MDRHSKGCCYKEEANFFANTRLAPRDAENPFSFKVRRGKVGGFRDYFEDEQIACLTRIVREELRPSFGYGEAV